MLYEMVAGQVPFPKTSLSAFHQPPKPIAEVEASVSPKLATLIHRMLTPKPLDRPGMREVLELLTPPATEVMVAVPAPPPPTRWGRLILLSALIAASIMAAGIYIGRTRSPQPHRPSMPRRSGLHRCRGPQSASPRRAVSGPALG